MKATKSIFVFDESAYGQDFLVRVIEIVDVVEAVDCIGVSISKRAALQTLLS